MSIIWDLRSYCGGNLCPTEGGEEAEKSTERDTSPTSPSSLATLKPASESLLFIMLLYLIFWNRHQKIYFKGFIFKTGFWKFFQRIFFDTGFWKFIPKDFFLNRLLKVYFEMFISLQTEFESLFQKVNLFQQLNSFVK